MLLRSALCVVVLVTGVAACGDDADEREALRTVVDAYLDAVNRGDAETAIALFAADASFSISFYDEYPRAAVEEDIVWDAAQGSRYLEPRCEPRSGGDAATGSEVGDGLAIECDTEVLNALAAATGAPAVPVSLSFVVADGRIRQLAFRYRGFFTEVTGPFEAWVESNRPDQVGSVGHLNWDSLEGARQNGELTRRLADEWAEYLRANGCTWADWGC